MLVRKILPEERERLAVVDQEAPLVAAARELRDAATNLVIVCDASSGGMMGVITKTDVVARISQCTGANCTMPVASVMTREVVACRPEQPLSDVWTIMKERQLKRLPVVDGKGKPIALLSARQVMEGLLREVEQEEELLRGLHHVHGLPVVRRKAERGWT
jgi:CBS domain-containing protein